MNAEAKAVSAAIKMKDGRTVEFGKERAFRVSEVDGVAHTVRVDFVTGDTVRVTAPESIREDLEVYGLSRRLAVAAGSGETVKESVEAVTALAERLHAGQWSARQSEGLAGASVLARAVIEFKRSNGDTRPASAIRDSLKELSNEQKFSIRKDPRISAIVQRIEATKRSRKRNAAETTKTVDGLLGSL